MQRLFFLLLMLALFAGKALSQDYVTAVGIRGGAEAVGVNVKYFTGMNAALEGIVSFRNLFSSNSKGYIFTGLYDFQTRAFRVRHLYWFYGGGAHAGNWPSTDGLNGTDPNENAFVAGIDGLVGIEHNIPDFPISISLDFKPYFNIWGTRDNWFDAAISLRYRIN